MTPENIISQIEHLMGRQPQAYMIRLMNDGLLDMASTKKNILLHLQQIYIIRNDGMSLAAK